MPHTWSNKPAPETAKDQMPVEDVFASSLAKRLQTDSWRKKLTIIRGEILEFAEQSSRHGLVDLSRETAELARTLDQLESLLGLENK